MRGALDTMSLHGFDNKLERVAGSGGQTAGVVRDEEQAAIEAFNEKDHSIRMDIRRGLEIRLVKKFDKAKIDPRRECWFLMDCRWLNEWAYFVEGKEGADPPGIISSAELLDENKEPLPGLEAKIDYRGVPPDVYFIFKELYGVDSNYPMLCRYKVDIYAPSVPDDQIVKIVAQPMRLARVKVSNIRARWEVQPSVDEGDDDECCKCCGLTKDHYEAFLFWAFTCCLRKKSGRSSISYRQYTPLKRTRGGLDDSSHHSQMDMSSTSSIGSGIGSGSDMGDYDLDLSRRSTRSTSEASSVDDPAHPLNRDPSWSGQFRYWRDQLLSWSV